MGMPTTLIKGIVIWSWEYSVIYGIMSIWQSTNAKLFLYLGVSLEIANMHEKGITKEVPQILLK